MGERNWNLLMPDPAESADLPGQYFALALAYLDSAKRLCELLARSYRTATYERGAVVLFLAAHAVELYLKGAILRAAPNETFSHDLEHLHNRYKVLYPAKRFKFVNVFRVEYPEMSAAERAEAKKASPPVDQLHRYPADKKNNPWPGLYAFEANSFLEDLRHLNTEFRRLMREHGG